MNNICLIGRETKDLELFNEGKIGKISVAVPRQYKNKEGNYDTDFFDCIIFNPTEYLKDNLIKGTLVSIEGRLQNRVYQDEKQNNHRITEIIVNRVNVLGNSKKSVEEPKNSKNKPFEEFGQQFEYGKQEEIDMESEYPF